MILLAGGAGTRMDCPKGLLPFKGKPWVLEQINRFKDVGGRTVVVVLGNKSSKYLKDIPDFKYALDTVYDYRGMNLKVVVNKNFESGQFSSLQVGIRGLFDGKDSACFISTVDTPLGGPEAYRSLEVNMSEFPNLQVVVPEVQGKGGHPILLSRTFALSLLSLDPWAETSRLDSILRMAPWDQVRRVPVGDPLITLNINTPEDWRSFVASCEKKARPFS